MRYKIAVCDDEKTMLQQINLYLTKMQEETKDEYDLHYYTSAEELLKKMPSDAQVILLDIAMGDMTGMECAKTLRAKGCSAEMIFITNMTEYAVEGYDVQAFAFIPKPIVYDELKKRLTDCLARAKPKQKSIFPVETVGGKELLPLNELLYVEVYQHELSFVLSDRRVIGNMQLSNAEKLLAPHGFFRPHRSYLVNMANIRRIDPDGLTMRDGTKIPVSKHRRKEFMDAFTNYMGGHFA